MCDYNFNIKNGGYLGLGTHYGENSSKRSIVKGQIPSAKKWDFGIL